MNAYDFTAETLQGQPAAMADYRGKVLLIANTASKCGFTPQYEGLEALYRKFKDRGFAVLGFPCNQFGAQEPGDAAQIGAFCALHYGLSFPMMAKVDVNGPRAHPLFAWLKHQRRGLLGSEAVKWNFTKFLIGRDGDAKQRFAPSTAPAAISAAIEAAL